MLKSFVDFMTTRGYKIDLQCKDDSRLMKFLNFFVRIFNKNFMTKYVTTVGNKIYFPSLEYMYEDEARAIRLICHELQHILDKERIDKKYVTGTFNFAYLFPQILAICSLGVLLAFIWPVCLWYLCFLVFLLPFPAKDRINFEVKAYAVSLYCLQLKYEYEGKKFDHELHSSVIALNLVGPNYYYAGRSPKKLTKRLIKLYKDAQSMKILFPLTRDISNWFDKYYSESA